MINVLTFEIENYKKLKLQFSHKTIIIRTKITQSQHVRQEIMGETMQEKTSSRSETAEKTRHHLKPSHRKNVP